MAKEKMVCPISNRMCVDCAIYRGRHYYLCFSKGYHGCLLESEEIKKLKEKDGSETVQGAGFDFPDDVFKSLKCIENIEDIVMKMDMHAPSA